MSHFVKRISGLVLSPPWSFAKIVSQTATESLYNWGFEGSVLVERLVTVSERRRKRANNAKVNTCQEYVSTQ